MYHEIDKHLKSYQLFAFWYITIDMSKLASRGGWWGFGTERIADISEIVYWKISISDKSVYILKLQ